MPSLGDTTIGGENPPGQLQGKRIELVKGAQNLITFAKLKNLLIGLIASGSKLNCAGFTEVRKKLQVFSVHPDQEKELKSLLILAEEREAQRCIGGKGRNQNEGNEVIPVIIMPDISGELSALEMEIGAPPEFFTPVRKKRAGFLALILAVGILALFLCKRPDLELYEIMSSTPPPSLGTIPSFKFEVKPRLKAYKIGEQVGSIVEKEGLKSLSSDQLALLTKNGFVISPSNCNEMHGVYNLGGKPFITPDSVFHAYHVLMFDTIKRMEESWLSEKLSLMVKYAHRNSQKIYANSPADMKDVAKDSMVFWAIAAKLMDSGVQPESSVAGQVETVVRGIESAGGHGISVGNIKILDFSIFEPVAGYENNGILEKYFRCNRFLNSLSIPFQTDEDSKRCAAICLALFSDTVSRNCFLSIRKMHSFFSGKPDDVTPDMIVKALQETFPGNEPYPSVSDFTNGRKLKERFMEFKKPLLTRQSGIAPGKDDSDWGLRIFSPGLTLRAFAFQKVSEKGIIPSGKQIAYLLNNHFENISGGEKEALEEAKSEFGTGVIEIEGKPDIHSFSMAALTDLMKDGGEGFPSFMNSSPWLIKTANTQLGAWSQVEHDTMLYSKENINPLCGTLRNQEFHGYVEPVPNFYNSLARVVHYSRTTFENFGVFKNISTYASNAQRKKLGYLGTTTLSELANFRFATGNDYKELEDMLLMLTKMSVKELEEQPFDEKEMELLKNFGEKLKTLAFNFSNTPDAQVPMSTIVCVNKDEKLGKGLYVGVGRPSTIKVIVPWLGEFHLCTGGVYSYYEFLRNLNPPLTDGKWKKETGKNRKPKEFPWLTSFGVGLPSPQPGQAESAAIMVEKGETTRNSIGMIMRRIEPGNFMMGSTEGPVHEKPAHKVTISKPFFIGIYEVTQAQYLTVMGSNPAKAPNPKGPVNRVSWEEAKSFCERLSQSEGGEYRLPTEAEWEYSCRAGTKTVFYWGDVENEDYLWCNLNRSGGDYSVGEKEPNAWGLYDMSGGVSEWCEDWYEMYKPEDQKDPTGAGSGTFRILRGGTWVSEPLLCRSTQRFGAKPSYRSMTAGFRVLRSVLEP